MNFMIDSYLSKIDSGDLLSEDDCHQILFEYVFDGDIDYDLLGDVLGEGAVKTLNKMKKNKYAVKAGRKITSDLSPVLGRILRPGEKTAKRQYRHMTKVDQTLNPAKAFRNTVSQNARSNQQKAFGVKDDTSKLNKLMMPNIKGTIQHKDAVIRQKRLAKLQAKSNK